VLREATIQVKPGPGDDVESLVAKAVAIATRAPEVESAHAYSKAESEKLLEPWLGAGLDLSQLPVPRLIVVQLRGQRSEDLTTLRSALASAVPEADLDDHRMWSARLGAMADAVVVLAAALFVLMIVAMGTAIGFATRGAMAGNREIIEVLHLVGASNAFIAKEFQGHFRRLGLRGAMIGGLAAIAFFALASVLSFWWAHSPGGDEIAAMFGSFALGSSGYLALVIVCAAVTLLTGLLSREIVMRHLQSLQ
jgi:cell division transport system permease protein